MDAPLHALSIAQAGELLRTQALTPLQLVQACLARTDAQEPQLHAFITRTADAALAQAELATREIAAGHWRGPLHGIPIAHKDVLLTRGVRTTAHSRALEHWVPDTDAVVVQRLAQAGAISLGKTACHEFAFGSPASDDVFPPARNPWNPLHMPGSSSSGSGTAVSAGFCLGATGTDTGGSVRHPAAACGLVGFKPTRGLLPLDGVIPLAPSMDHVGLLTRSVGDAVLMFAAMRGDATHAPTVHTPHTPQTAGASGMPAPHARATSGTSTPPRTALPGLRIGVMRRQLLAQAHDPEIWQCFEDVLARCRAKGAHVIDVELEGSDQAVRLANTLIGFQGYQQLQHWVRDQPQLLGQGLRRRLVSAAEVTPPDHWQACVARWQLEQTLEQMLTQQVDVLLSPGRETPPETLDALMHNPTGQRSSCNRLYSLTGHPALTLPMGLHSSGLPMALQLATAQHSDDRLLGLALRLQSCLPWDPLHPANPLFKP
ncbi:amidase [Limnohabitans sp.]|uniref:amidase n=1 Tax=Limnohabitans sp. TaxID=1907725 RepID=UPI0038BC4E68